MGFFDRQKALRKAKEEEEKDLPSIDEIKKQDIEFRKRATQISRIIRKMQDSLNRK